MDKAEQQAISSNDSGSLGGDSGVFATTHWSIVLGVAKADAIGAAAALEELCRKYWYPLYAFIRRRGFGPHEAEDLTQAFFAFLLEKEALKKVDRDKGKFRTFLLAALTNFLSNEWHRKQTLKRGGGSQFLSLDELDAEEKYRHELADSLTPEKLFERRWATAVIEQVLARLKLDYEQEGKGPLFAKLKIGLTGEIGPGQYANWADALEMSHGAVKVALHRLRRRFGELLRQEIAQTVTSPAEVEEEIRQLFAAISS